MDRSEAMCPAGVRPEGSIKSPFSTKPTSTFITNNTQCAASSVGELYQARWGIEVFFKQLKQTLQICDFLPLRQGYGGHVGHSKEAIRWQLWAALLLYVLMRWQGQAAMG